MSHVASVLDNWTMCPMCMAPVDDGMLLLNRSIPQDQGYNIGSSLVENRAFLLPLFLVGTIVFFMKSLERKRKPGEPPIVPGLPFLGCSKEFSKDAVKFLLSKRSKFGDVFTVPMPFVNLHVVMNPHLVTTFSRHPHLSFEPIQRMVNKNVFQFQLFDAKRIMKEAAHKARFATEIPDNFIQFLHFVNEKLEDMYQNTPMEQHLMESLSHIQFRAIYNSIFGNMDHEKLNYLTASQHFKAFHQYFSYLWLGFPLSMFPKAKKALQTLVEDFPQAERLLQKPDLCNYMRHAVQRMSEAGQSHQAIVGHNLVYLHVNCNTIKTTFWLLCNILKDKTAFAKLREEIWDLVHSRADEMGNVHISIREAEQLPILDSIVTETFRLCSGVFMIREATQDTELLVDPETNTNVNIRKGDKVGFYPPALHHDPEIFTSPEEFQYSRFVKREFYYRDKLLRNPVWPFGTICPGQRLALLQIKLTAMVFVSNFDFQYAFGSDMPAYDQSTNGHEILAPMTDVKVSFNKLNAKTGNVFYKIHVDS